MLLRVLASTPIFPFRVLLPRAWSYGFLPFLDLFASASLAECTE